MDFRTQAGAGAAVALRCWGVSESRLYRRKSDHRPHAPGFCGLVIEDSIPDATTLWLFREKLAKAGLIEKLFERFDQHLAAQGYMARGGQMIDATIVPVPKQRTAG